MSRLNAIRSLGIHIALDDFGTGYSSLSYLKKFPIDAIKIDQSFVRDILYDVEDAALTQAIIALGQALKLQVIAEGVENQDVMNKLEGWGCHHIQGYYINRPLLKNNMQTWLEDNLNTQVEDLSQSCIA